MVVMYVPSDILDTGTIVTEIVIVPVPTDDIYADIFAGIE